MTQYRNWMFTIFKDNNVCDLHHQLRNQDRIQYMIYQLEECPETRRLHLQGYCEFRKMTTLKQAKSLLGATAHLEKRRGSQAEAISYCSKQDTRIAGPFIIGEKAVQGKRTDLEYAVNALDSGKSVKEIIQEKPNMLKYINHMQKYKALNESPRNIQDDIQVEVIVGPPGSGKTRSVFEVEPDLYTVPEPNNGSLWFDGYTGQEAVLFDDFYGQIKYHYLLRLLDRYPLQVAVKGGFTQWKPRRVYITSNKDVHQWYNRPEYEALKRRIKNIHIFEVAGNTMPPPMSIDELIADTYTEHKE